MVGRLFSLFIYTFLGEFIIDFWSYIFGLKARRYPRTLHNDDSVAGISKGMDLRDQYIENTNLDNEKLSKSPFLKFIINILILLSYLVLVISYFSLYIAYASR